MKLFRIQSTFHLLPQSLLCLFLWMGLGFATIPTSISAQSLSDADGGKLARTRALREASAGGVSANAELNSVFGAPLSPTAARVPASSAATTSTLAQLQLSEKERVGTTGTLALRMIQGLLLCGGVFFIGIFLYRKMTGQKITLRSARRLAIVERCALSSKASLLLCKLDGREVLLAVGADRVTKISAESNIEIYSDEETAHGVIPLTSDLISERMS